MGHPLTNPPKDGGRGLANKAGTAVPSSFKKGGTVKKTGMAKVHKGEKVIPAGPKGKRQSTDDGYMVKKS